MLFHVAVPSPCKSMDNFGGALAAPGVKLITPLRGMISLKLDSLFKCCDSQVSTEILALRYNPSKFAAMHCRCVFLRGCSLIVRLA